MPKSKARRSARRQARVDRREKVRRLLDQGVPLNLERLDPRSVAAPPSESPQVASLQPPLHVPQEDRRLELLRSLDSHAFLRGRLSALAESREEWAGIPMPIDQERLVIEPSYPYAALGAKPEPLPEGVTLRNTFYSHKYRVDVYVFQEADGRITKAIEPAFHGLDKQLHTIGASFAWGIEQEAKALQLLGTMVRHHTMKQYLLTGMFMETSPRSGVTYLFRKLRPTVAMRRNRKGTDMRVLCCLCMHPIGYYANSWGGAMCPTDDVIAHLSLMRADEPMFWRRCNQHPAHRPEGGL